MSAATRDIGITRLAVYEPSFSTDDAKREHFARYAADLAPAVADGRRGDVVARFMTFAGMPTEMVDQMRTAQVWPLFEAVAPTLVHDAEALDARTSATVPVDTLARITAATMVVDGGASPELLRAPARAVAAAVPGAEHITLAGQTHDVAADVLAPVLLKFFA
ncbi:hypothetical protein [Kitasatospora sp. NPDC056181]|uniref:hypothetical protein n=1 Tax=Kitasatospora sp. NPDC056181 TaxID=3345737 RepID=UPI0035D7A8E7